MINQFNTSTCKIVQQKAMDAIQRLADEWGVDLWYDGGKYSDDEYVMKIKFTVQQTASGESVEQLQFAKVCEQYGVPASAYGQVLDVQGKRLRLTGFALNRSKFCVKVTDLGTGKAMLYPEAVLESVQVSNSVPKLSLSAWKNKFNN